MKNTRWNCVQTLLIVLKMSPNDSDDFMTPPELKETAQTVIENLKEEKRNSEINTTRYMKSFYIAKARKMSLLFPKLFCCLVLVKITKIEAKYLVALHSLIKSRYLYYKFRLIKSKFLIFLVSVV